MWHGVGLKSVLRCVLVAAMSVLVVSAGEWSEDAEDLGKCNIDSSNS